MKTSVLPEFVKEIKDSLATLEKVKRAKVRTLDSYVLPEKLKAMKIADATYHVNKAANLPTFELQDALMDILKYHAPAAGLRPDRLVWGVTDGLQIVILYDGKEIAKPEMTKDGMLDINYTDKSIKLPKFTSGSVLSIADSKEVITKAVEHIKDKGYGNVEVAGINLHIYKVSDDHDDEVHYAGVMNGSVVVDPAPVSELELTEVLQSPNNQDMPTDTTAVFRSSPSDQALVTMAQEVCSDLKALKSEMKSKLFNDPLHSGQDEFFLFYRTYIAFVLYVKAMSGNVDFGGQAVVIPETDKFVQDLKCKLDQIANQSAGAYRGLNQAANELMYHPVFRYCKG